jgi:preprotein translocase subunit SecY
MKVCESPQHERNNLRRFIKLLQRLSRDVKRLFVKNGKIIHVCRKMESKQGSNAALIVVIIIIIIIIIIIAVWLWNRSNSNIIVYNDREMQQTNRQPPLQVVRNSTTSMNGTTNGTTVNRQSQAYII